MCIFHSGVGLDYWHFPNPDTSNNEPWVIKCIESIMMFCGFENRQDSRHRLTVFNELETPRNDEVLFLQI